MTTRDEKMNKLALRLSATLNGEDLLDVAIVCARTIAFAINEAYDNDTEKFQAANRLIEFLKADLETMMQDAQEMSRH